MLETGFCINIGFATDKPFPINVKVVCALPVGPVAPEFDRDTRVDGKYGKEKLSCCACVLRT
jgi:hypothetical protein